MHDNETAAPSAEHPTTYDDRFSETHLLFLPVALVYVPYIGAVCSSPPQVSTTLHLDVPGSGGENVTDERGRVVWLCKKEKQKLDIVEEKQ